jgi:hypothetical protein
VAFRQSDLSLEQLHRDDWLPSFVGPHRSRHPFVAGRQHLSFILLPLLRAFFFSWCESASSSATCSWRSPILSGTLRPATKRDLAANLGVRGLQCAINQCSFDLNKLKPFIRFGLRPKVRSVMFRVYTCLTVDHGWRLLPRPDLYRE